MVAFESVTSRDSEAPPWGNWVLLDKNFLFVNQSIGSFALCVNGKGGP